MEEKAFTIKFVDSIQQTTIFSAIVDRLCALSPPFAKMLVTPMQETNTRIIVFGDIDYNEFLQYIEFLQHGTCTIDGFAMLQTIMRWRRLWLLQNDGFTACLFNFDFDYVVPRQLLECALETPSLIPAIATIVNTHHKLLLFTDYQWLWRQPIQQTFRLLALLKRTPKRLLFTQCRDGMIIIWRKKGVYKHADIEILHVKTIESVLRDYFDYLASNPTISVVWTPEIANYLTSYTFLKRKSWHPFGYELVRRRSLFYICRMWQPPGCLCHTFSRSLSPSSFSPSPTEGSRMPVLSFWDDEQHIII